MRQPRVRAARAALGTIVALLLTAAIDSPAQTTSSTVPTTTTSLATTTTSSSTTTTIPPELQCKDRLLQRARRMNNGLTRCSVLARKRARKEKPFDEPTCVARAIGRYDRTTVAAPRFFRGCLDCTADAVVPVRDGMAATHTELSALVACAPEVPIAERAGCEIALLKALRAFQGRLIRCRREAARTAFAGGMPDEKACIEAARDLYDMRALRRTRAARRTCPPCVRRDHLAAVAAENTQDMITLAHCPCRFGGPDDECGECQACDVEAGCIPAHEGESCGRNGCDLEECQAGECRVHGTRSCRIDACSVSECVDDGSCVGTACCVDESENVCERHATQEGFDCVQSCFCTPSPAACTCTCDPGCEYTHCFP